ncbi:MAG TPA: polysaccharide deacetylase family protein, partial [Chloroflexota bacterium]|nr:polysaccharide deacetylase family protein [Chloroflexota bacterium]
PYGDENASVLRDVGEVGYHYSVLWTVDSTGWEGSSIKHIVDRCLGKVETGAIYVMHVGVQSLDIDALPQVVDGLRAKNYRFAMLRELLAANPENS